MPHKDPAAQKEYQKAYAKRRSEYKKKTAKEWREANPKGHWASHLKNRYGLTLTDYQQLVKRQGNKCAICFSKKPGGRGRWHVDHDHASGKVRGLLCQHCNLGLGHFRDNPLFLASAIDYLKAANGQ